MGGGYKDYCKEGYPNYRHTVVAEYAFPRLYSGGTAASFVTEIQRYDYNLNNYSCIFGQIGSSVYIIGGTTVPIGRRNSTVPSIDYTLIDDEEFKESILDYWPESWMAYIQNISPIFMRGGLYCYNHDTLVADGIEQS